MALPIIANTYRVAFRYRDSGGATAANIIHLRQTSGTAKTAVQVGTDVINSWVAPQLNLMASSASVQDVTVTPLDGTSASAVLTPSGAKWIGQVSGQPVPAQAAILKLSTALRGPRNRGRIFLPFPAESITAAGLLDPANCLSTLAGWLSFRTALQGLAAPLDTVVASYATPAANSVTSMVVETVAGTQRRRQSRLR